MKKIQNPSKTGYLIEMVILILMAFGTVFVFSAGARIDANYELKNFYSFTTLRNMVFFPVAVLFMYLVSMVDYRKFKLKKEIYKSYTPYLMLLSVILLILVLIIGQGIGEERSFALRWFRFSIGPLSISFQPSELAKWVNLIFLAAFISRFSKNLKSFKKIVVPICLFPAIVIALIITQDFGTAAFIGLITVIILLTGGIQWRYFIVPIPAMLLLGLVLYSTAPNSIINETRKNRIDSYLARFQPEKFKDLDVEKGNYQADQSVFAISNGQAYGMGLGRGQSKYGHLPEDTSDFIFAIICEEMGLVGAGIILVLFGTFVILGMIVVLRCQDTFGRILAGGIVTTIALQAAINIGVVTAVLPTKGIPLPFISAGGSSMILTAMAVGILLNIAHSVDYSYDQLKMTEEVSMKQYLSQAARAELGRGVSI